MPKYPMGSVSHGTLRTEDLIPAFIDALRSCKPCRNEHRQYCRQLELDRDTHDQILGTIDWYSTDDASRAAETLEGMLTEYAAPFHYFGAHPGDDSDFGFWLYHDWQQQLDECGGIVTDSLETVQPRYVGYIALVNERGNTTLYDRKHNYRNYLVWSYV